MREEKKVRVNQTFCVDSCCFTIAFSSFPAPPAEADAPITTSLCITVSGMCVSFGGGGAAAAAAAASLSLFSRSSSSVWSLRTFALRFSYAETAEPLSVFS